jgi:P27 family predicted phage terminase small subunit
MRGRKPKPTELKLVSGNPGKRKIEPRADSLGGVPKAPRFLSREARAEWNRLTADLAAMGVLGRENRATLAIYCQNWARMVAAEMHVNEHGPIVPAPRTGVPMHNPHLAVANRAAGIVAKLAAEFGLTPSSRTRVGAAPRALGVSARGDALAGDRRPSLAEFLASDPDLQLARVGASTAPEQRSRRRVP